MTRPVFGDLESGRRNRDEAMARVEEHASPDWFALAVRAGRYVARGQPELTTDDIWAVLDRYAIEAPHEPRAMGPVMRELSRSGAVVRTSRDRPTVRPQAHASPIRIWRSLLYGRGGRQLFS